MNGILKEANKADDWIASMLSGKANGKALPLPKSRADVEAIPYLSRNRRVKEEYKFPRDTSSFLGSILKPLLDSNSSKTFLRRIANSGKYVEDLVTDPLGKENIARVKKLRAFPSDTLASAITSVFGPTLDGSRAVPTEADLRNALRAYDNSAAGKEKAILNSLKLEDAKPLFNPNDLATTMPTETVALNQIKPETRPEAVDNGDLEALYSQGIKNGRAVKAGREKALAKSNPIADYLKNTLMHPSKWGTGTKIGVYGGGAAVAALASYYAYQKYKEAQEAKRRRRAKQAYAGGRALAPA